MAMAGGLIDGIDRPSSLLLMRIPGFEGSEGNQMVSELLVRSIARKGRMLPCPRDVIMLV